MDQFELPQSHSLHCPVNTLDVLLMPDAFGVLAAEQSDREFKPGSDLRVESTKGLGSFRYLTAEASRGTRNARAKASTSDAGPSTSMLPELSAPSTSPLARRRRSPGP